MYNKWPILFCSYTHKIEALSCDEALLDATSLLSELRITPYELAAAIRADVKERTSCCASVGMGEQVAFTNENENDEVFALFLMLY